MEYKSMYLVTVIRDGEKGKPFTADLFTLQQLLVRTSPTSKTTFEIEKFQMEVFDSYDIDPNDNLEQS